MIFSKFISINSRNGNETQQEFVNSDHIIRIYELEEGDVAIQLSTGDHILATGTTIGSLMDKLNVSNHIHIYNK